MTFKHSPDIIGGGKNLLPPMNDNSFYIDTSLDNIMINNSPATPWKYNEEEIVKELLEYIRNTLSLIHI